MSYVIPSWPTPALTVEGSIDTFPVRHIFCVGRNYAEHAKEMGHSEKEPPFFFTKGAQQLVPGGGNIHYPPGTSNFHHELELVVAIGKGGRRIPMEKALEYVYGYAIGLDMTRRDLQSASKAAGRPWAFGKDFDQAAPVGTLYPAATHGHKLKGKMELRVNGAVRQQGDLADQIWNVAETIAYLSNYYELQPGHIIMTGTPAGVAAVVAGDELLGTIEGLGELAVKILPPL